MRFVATQEKSELNNCQKLLRLKVIQEKTLSIDSEIVNVKVPDNKVDKKEKDEDDWCKTFRDETLSPI